MHQDDSWYGGSPQPRGLCFRWVPTLLPKNVAKPPKIFGPCLLWTNCWMDQDGTWHGGRPQPMRLFGLYVRWKPSPRPKKGTEPPNFRPMSIAVKRLQNRCMDQDALGMEVYLGPDDIVLDGDPARLFPKWGRSPHPNFRPMSIVAKRLDGSRWRLAWRWAWVQATLC